MRRPLVALVAALAALGGGCGRDAARRLTEEALAAQRSVPIPAVPATKLPAPPLRLRILVGPSALDVDAVDLLASWPEKRRARLLHELPEDEAAALPFVHRGLVRFAGGRIAPPHTPAPGQLEIRPLAEVLAYARELERRYAKLFEAETDQDTAPGAMPEVNVYAAEDTPFEILASVLYTAYQSEYAPILVARGPGGDVALPMSTPPPRVGATPRIVFRPNGLSVSLEPQFVGRVDELYVPRRARYHADTPPPGHLGRPILAADRACPSVPHHDGAPDLARLGELLGRIHARIPELEGAMIIPALDTPWRSVAGVAAMAADAGLAHYQVSIPRGQVPSRPCDGAVGVEELGPDDLTSFPGAR